MFWDSSIPDLLDLMQAIDDAEERRLKDNITLQFVNAEAIASRIGYLFNDPKKRKKSEILQPWDVYPRLFESEKQEVEEQESEANLAAQKRMMEYYSRKNNAKQDI